MRTGKKKRAVLVIGDQPFLLVAVVAKSATTESGTGFVIGWVLRECTVIQINSKPGSASKEVLSGLLFCLQTFVLPPSAIPLTSSNNEGIIGYN